MAQADLFFKLEAEDIDVTVPAKKQARGAFHPQTLTRNQITEIFTGMGFSVETGREIETDYYNFDALNMPKDHPARAEQDTFYITDYVVLRSQTSPQQIRVMEKTSPPIKMINPGRVYRSDEADATHSPMFHQVEGLVVDKNITLCDLKGTLTVFAKAMFGENTKTRFRPSYFPFTEPSMEMDASCSQCGGKGCRVCKGTGWIEILGSGMVNIKVLKNCGIDPAVYSGFAFGMGIDRIANIKYGISDMRIVFENDIKFISQFK
jgi:phenylalanyl-tRNA synthetase alpha chain